MRIVSLQSGTSADGIDVAVVDFSDPGTGSETELTPVFCTTVDLPGTLSNRVLAFTHGFRLTAAEVCELDTELGQAFASVASLVAEQIRLDTIDLVVSHGQTAYHWVSEEHTLGSLQLGDPSKIALAFDAPVLAQLRTTNIAAGGAGAPLMSIFDRMWLGGSRVPEATLNLGGIANLQYVEPQGPVGEAGTVIGWDTGPGNCLVDAVITRATGGAERFDRSGALAGVGTVDDELLAVLLRHPFLSLPRPKSTGRETFNFETVDHALAEHTGAGSALRVTHADLVATLTAFTARTIADDVASLPNIPSRLIVSGGGVHNLTLMRLITDQMRELGVDVVPSSDLGIPCDFKESLMFALLGFLSWHGIPIRLSDQEHERQSIIGHFVPGAHPLSLPRPLSRLDRITVRQDRTTLS